METFKQFIDEARRNPELNPKISIYKALEPYKDRDDMYITYTADVGKDFSGVTGKNISGFMVGINPKSTYNTPNGVYVYPLKVAWILYANELTQTLDVPFGLEQPMVSLLQQKPGSNIVELSKYSSKDYDRDYIKLAKMIIKSIQTNTIFSEAYAWEYAKGVLDRALKDARHKSPGGIWWNMTRYTFLAILSHATPESFFTSFEPDPEYAKEINDMVIADKMKANFGDMTLRLPNIELVGQPNTKSSNVWTKVFMDLGVDGVTDKAGKSIIHESEPMQGVFFNPSSYKVIGSFYNKGYVDKVRHELRDTNYVKIKYLNPSGKIFANSASMPGSLMSMTNFMSTLLRIMNKYDPVTIYTSTSSILKSLKRNNSSDATIKKDENWYRLEAVYGGTYTSQKYLVPDDSGNVMSAKTSRQVLEKGKWKFTIYDGSPSNSIITITSKGITFEKTVHGPIFASWSDLSDDKKSIKLMNDLESAKNSIFSTLKNKFSQLKMSKS